MRHLIHTIIIQNHYKLFQKNMFIIRMFIQFLKNQLINYQYNFTLNWLNKTFYIIFKPNL